MPQYTQKRKELAQTASVDAMSGKQRAAVVSLVDISFLMKNPVDFSAGIQCPICGL